MSKPTATGPPAHLDITQTVGMLAIGTVVGTLFYGMALLQTGLYFGKKQDIVNARRTSILVMSLIVLDTLSWLSETYAVWFYFVKNYANPEKLGVLFWEFQIEPIFTYTAAFLAQMFFIEKIWILSGKNRLLGGILTLIAMVAWTTGLAIDGFILSEDALVSRNINRVNIIQKASSTVIEVSIGVFMTLLLSLRKNGFSSETDNILNSLIVFALSRGLVLTSVQVGYTAVFFAYPEKLFWVVFQFSLAKIGTNSVLASLNVRELIQSSARGSAASSGDVSRPVKFLRHGTSRGASTLSTGVIMTTVSSTLEGGDLTPNNDTFGLVDRAVDAQKSPHKYSEDYGLTTAPFQMKSDPEAHMFSAMAT